MKRFAVSLQLIKPQRDCTETTILRTGIIGAVSAEEALGTFISSEKKSEFRVGACRVVEIPDLQPEKPLERTNSFELVEQWARDRELDKQDPAKGMCKIMEEVGELSAALIRKDIDKIVDGIGDSLVTLISFALQNYLSAEECLALAYNEIKDRKGETVDGVFIKDGDMK